MKVLEQESAAPGEMFCYRVKGRVPCKRGSCAMVTTLPLR